MGMLVRDRQAETLTQVTRAAVQEFVRDTGCKTPEEVVNKKLKSEVDWCNLLNDFRDNFVLTGQVSTGQVRTGQVRTGQVRTGQVSP